VFRKVEPQDLFDYLSQIIQNLAQELNEDVIQRSYLYQAFKQLNRLKEIFRSNQDKGLRMDFVLKLFRQIFRELKLPFEGEPLQGLQIMGVLESRNLDFRRVIICDVNEGSFPPGGGINSMIPFNLRRAFCLPVQEQNDAIYAYTFYRLLHRAEEVHLIYTTAADQGKANEVSRFVQQMQAELHVSKPQSVMIPVELTPSKEILMTKTPEILERLFRYVKKEEKDPLSKSFSASALSMYLDCRLRFYFRYVAGLKEKEEVVSEIDPMTFGTLLHSALEFLYEVEEGKPHRDIDSHTINRLLPQVPEAVDKSIRRFYKKENKEELEISGQLLIAREVFIKYVKEILSYDQKNGPFRVIGLEKEYEGGIPVDTRQGRVEIALKGVIDRLDIKDGVVRLLDYKTGKDNKKVSSIASLFNRDDDKRNKAAMQTLLYAYFYQYKHRDNLLPLKPGIFNIKEIYNPQFSPFLVMDKEEISDYRDFAVEFESGLSGLLAEIFDPGVPFDQTEDVKKCAYCAYKEICGR
jgi:CRISPR/Cas system-associated exonuclease Cas4 (RecB family)